MTIIEVKQQRLDELLAIRAEKGTNPEIAREIHELQKQIWAHKHHSFNVEEALTRKLFGKPWKEMTPAERAEYRRLAAPHRVKRGGWENSLTRQLFGKKRSEMTAAEVSKYHRELAKRKGDA